MSLVLSRKEHEVIRIGDSITITVAKTRPGGCTLSIEAPKDLRIVRGELKDDESEQHKHDSPAG